MNNDFINEFPLQIANRERLDSGYFTLEISKNEKVFGNLLINYEDTYEEYSKMWKCCNQFNEFKYIPSMQPEILDSDFFRIMKHSIMNETYCTNYKQSINKKIVLNEKEFHDALDMRVNDKDKNNSWMRDGNDHIINIKNKNRRFDLFLWDFWAGWGHGTTMRALSCHRCSDKNSCKGTETKAGMVENTRKGYYEYEPLKIKIPFP